MSVVIKRNVCIIITAVLLIGLFVIMSGEKSYADSFIAEFPNNNNQLEYNGKVRHPAVNVYDSTTNKKLTKNVDYTIKYSAVIKNVGVYKIHVKGIGKYSDSMEDELNFVIYPKKAVIKSVKGLKKSAKITIVPHKGGVKKYEIWYRVKGKKAWKSKVVSKTKVTIKNLKSKKKYQFRVFAFFKHGGMKIFGDMSKIKAAKIK